jgi:hypothetical protein
LPIIYSSGRRAPNQIDQVPGAGFLPKPYSLSEVDTAVAPMVDDILT